MELEPNFFYGHGVLGEALFLNGDFAAGIAEYENAYRLRPGVPPLAYMAAAYALKGDHEKVKSTVARAMEQEKSDGSPFYYGRAVISLALGDKAAAVENLEKSYEAKENGPISEIRVDPLLDPLRGDQRFEKLVNKVVPPDS